MIGESFTLLPDPPHSVSKDVIIESLSLIPDFAEKFSHFLQIFLTFAEIVDIIKAIRAVTRKFIAIFLTFVGTVGIIKDNEIRYQLLSSVISNINQETPDQTPSNMIMNLNIILENLYL